MQLQDISEQYDVIYQFLRDHAALSILYLELSGVSYATSKRKNVQPLERQCYATRCSFTRSPFQMNPNATSSSSYLINQFYFYFRSIRSGSGGPTPLNNTILLPLTTALPNFSLKSNNLPPSTWKTLNLSFSSVPWLFTFCT
jgi:hypothetical protein